MKKSVDLKIEKLIYGGKGMALHQGEVVFVPFVLPGEQVRVQLVQKKQKHWEGVLEEVLEPSPNRIEPNCPYFLKCGGCQWQHINYETQLKWKEKIVHESLIRIGKIDSPKVLPTISAQNQWGWRNRILIHSKGKGSVGFYQPNSHDVVDTEKCLIAEDSINKQLTLVREEIKDIKKDVEIRSQESSGFAQVNSLQNEVLKKLVLEWAQEEPHQNIVELFCGNGNFSSIFAGCAKKLVGVDLDSGLIADAKKKLWQSSQTEFEFHAGDATKFFTDFMPDEPIDLLLLDPPRDGAAKVVEGVMKHQPKNILYISCNPTTLARDIRFLKDFAGYHLVQAQPVDMFPQTFHTEVVAQIQKN